MLLVRMAFALGLLAALPGTSVATPFAVVPGPIELGTTDEFATPTITGTAEVLGDIPGFPTTLTLSADLTLGSAIILNPLEASLADLHATLSGGPAPVTIVGFDLLTTFTDLSLTIDGGWFSAIDSPFRDFALEPLTVLLPATPLSLNVLDQLAGTASFTLGLDLEIDLPGYPAYGPPASLVLRGDIAFSQVPGPSTLLLLAIAMLIGLPARKSSI
ncbi:MAG: hypothetical protein GY937_13795 [bacterium]|nr:hypothetical protein [bacterium]MCP5057778.1 hypothetical protein [bacterium]